MKRTFKDDSGEIVEVKFKLTDEEIIESIVDKPVDERVTFFKKLFKTDVKNILTLKFLKQFLNTN